VVSTLLFLSLNQATMKAEDIQKDGGQSGDDKKDKKRHGFTSNKSYAKVNFEGDCDDLKGFIYDCSDLRQTDMFMKTNKKVAEYVDKKYKDYTCDMQALVKNLEMPKFVLPIDPPASASETEKRIWEKKCDSYAKREETLEQNLQQLFAIVMGQYRDYAVAVTRFIYI
jgi:hypothetical protein